MSVNFTVLLVAAGLAVATGAAALLTARGTRREVSALRRELAGLSVPGPRDGAADIRSAVAEALADERERELAEARAFWAEQEAREGAEDAGLPRGPFGALGGLGGPAAPGPVAAPGDEPADGPAGLPGHRDYEVPPVLPYLPRQADFAGIEPGLDATFDAAFDAARDAAAEPEAPEVTLPAPGAIPHPSGPDFAPSPVVASQDQTADRLTDLADGRIPLADVRPGPLGTLDVYVFADGTTLCMTPGHRETALKLCEALDRGDTPVLRGGSAIAGAYALTFAYGDEAVYVLADRVVASL
ncbi:hypothetical protein SAMN05216223_104539 [Actinacidiphila yanglinensis]|uniref:Secreted protein n=1 Tax=Actinacidiphila yanglinensis TaxID=310779 RepID=A0A1H5ZM01_9ACTN|nr:hypothetical protein [Actinacidiphila yanglinensis]SEG36386.1 hypothetical protein SAMN05216223_104539 [Actinacidiphila yanglinensis]